MGKSQEISSISVNWHQNANTGQPLLLTIHHRHQHKQFMKQTTHLVSVGSYTLHVAMFDVDVGCILNMKTPTLYMPLQFHFALLFSLALVHR